MDPNDPVVYSRLSSIFSCFEAYPTLFRGQKVNNKKKKKRGIRAKDQTLRDARIEIDGQIEKMCTRLLQYILD